MHRIFTILILLISWNAIGQNWQPIDTSMVYHFDTTNTDVIIKSISSTQQNDTTFFSKILISCPQIICNPQNVNQYASYLKNVPDFMGKYMVNNFDTSYTFYGYGDFVIKPHKNIGDSWSFNDTTLATVIAKENRSFGTNQDSVKIVLLQTQDTLIFSKSHGIIKIPYFHNGSKYEQIGIQDVYGLQDLSFTDIYDFNVGDIFQYRMRELVQIPLAVDDLIISSFVKREVLSKDISQDSASYTYLEYRQINNLDNDLEIINRIFLVDTVKENYQRYNVNDPWLNLPIGDWLQSKDTIIYSIDSLGKVPIDYFHSRAYYFEDSLQVQSKQVSFALGPYSFNVRDPDISDVDEKEFIVQQYHGRFVMQYKKGLGVVIRRVEDSADRSYDIELIGYYKGIDTIGIIYSDQFLLTSSTNLSRASTSLLNFHPNPTESHIQVTTINQGKVVLKLYDIVGKLVYNKTIIGQEIIDLSYLNPGIYNVKAINQGKYSSSSLIVK